MTRAARRRRTRRRWLRAAAVAALVLVALALAGGYGYARLRVDQIASVHLPGLAPAPPPGRPMNLLVVGSDTRQGLDRRDRGQFGDVQGQRGDVILLVRLVPATHRAWMLSIPRDLYVPVAGTGGRAKLNAALAKGPEQLVETIKADFGIPVNHYLLVDFDGFRAVVDAIGGVRLDFPYPVRDDDQGHNNSGLLVATPGCRHLDGEQALALARSRYFQYRGPDGAWHADPGYDLGRIRRQQVLLRALAAQALRRGQTNAAGQRRHRGGGRPPDPRRHPHRRRRGAAGRPVPRVPPGLAGRHDHPHRARPAPGRRRPAPRPARLPAGVGRGRVGGDPAARPARGAPDGGEVPGPPRAPAPLAIGPRRPPRARPALGPLALLSLSVGRRQCG
jgi:LCP family protein required for cell wall assembly